MEKKVEQKKFLITGDDALVGIFNGIEKLSKAVISTLGPHGRNVYFRNSDGVLQSTKDGITVIRNADTDDPLEKIGFDIIKYASEQTSKKVGDGTTTTALLTYFLIKNGINLSLEKNKIGKRKFSPLQFRKGVDKALSLINDYIEQNKRNINNINDLLNVARISANNDEHIGEMVANAMQEVGVNGSIIVEEGKTYIDQLDFVEGMQFERGYKSHYFVTDEINFVCHLDNPYVLLYDGRITAANEIISALQVAHSDNRSLLVIADDIDGEALSTMIVNKIKNNIRCAAVKAPDFGDRKTERLEDIAVLTGGTVISIKKGMRLDKISASNIAMFLGRARRASITRDDTTIIDGEGDISMINDRVEKIKQRIESTESGLDKEMLQDRLAKLTGGVAVIKAGGYNEMEILEKKDRIEDALYAARSAQNYGVLPGGGAFYVGLEEHLSKNISRVHNRDEIEGYTWVMLTMREPFFQILRNAGKQEEEIHKLFQKLKGKIKRKKWTGFAINEKDDIVFGDPFSIGVIDPSEVIYQSIMNAVNTAYLFLITSSAIFEIDDNKNNKLMF